MSQNKPESMEKAHVRILHWGIIIDIFLPLVIFFLAVYFRDRFIHIRSVIEINIIFYVLLIVSLGETAAIFIIRKRFWATFTSKVGHPPEADSLAEGKEEGQGFSPAQNKLDTNTHQSADRYLFTFGIIIFTLCFSPTLYGLVYYLLGGTWEHFALFVAITFLSFQLFKPKSEEIEKLSRDLKTEG